jgi:hypothetical protein
MMPVKTLITFLTIGFFSAWLAGCATTGGIYDDSKIAMIKKDVTTEAELLEWFGPASTRTLAPDGSKNVAWRFAPRKAGAAGSSGKLEVRFGTDGKVAAYTASCGTR